MYGYKIWALKVINSEGIQITTYESTRLGSVMKS